MKIIIIRNVSPYNLYGGIRKHCDQLFSLFKDNFDIEILKIENIEGNNIPIINKRYFKRKALIKYLETTNYDIIHLHGFASLEVIQVLQYAKKRNKIIVYSPHFHPFEFLQRPILGKAYFSVCLKPLLSVASAIFTISNTDTLFFNRYHNNVIKIPHQFDGKITKYLGPKKSNMLLFVGRNEINKGLDHLYSIPENKYEIHCVTKGKLKRQDFIQYQNISNNELGTLYEQASLVLVPSRYEAFSYVVLEAFSHRTPVLMSNNVQISDYLIGYSGYNIFNYKDYEEFNEKIDKTIGMHVDTEHILDQFKLERIKKIYENAYKNVLKK